MGYRYSKNTNLHYMDDIEIVEIFLCPEDECYLICYVPFYGSALFHCNLEVLIEMFSRATHVEAEVLQACTEKIMSLDMEEIGIDVSKITDKECCLDNLIVILEEVEFEVDEDLEKDPETFIIGKDLPPNREFVIKSIVEKRSPY